MGLGGVAIAVLPSVAYPQTVVLGQAGGGGGLVVKLICQYSYGILSVYLCWTLGTR